MGNKLIRVCQEWVQQLDCWSEVAPRGKGVTSAIVARRWLGWWLAEEGVDDKQAEQFLADHCEQIISMLRLLRACVDSAILKAQERDAEIRVNDLAVKAASSIAKKLIEDEEVNDIEIEMIMSTYVANRAPIGRKVSREQFATYREHYDERWRTEGEPRLHVEKYSTYRLGHDRKPPLSVARRENTWDGLQRSVYSRFTMAASDPHVVGDSKTIAEAEIARTCSTLGLRHSWAHVALRSLSYGLYLALNGKRSWESAELCQERQWRTETTPLVGEDTGRNDDMARYAEMAMRTFARKEDQGKYLRCTDQLEEASGYVMKRAWMLCFQRDRREQAIDGQAGAKIINEAIYHGIPSGEEYRRRARTLMDRPTLESLCDQESAETVDARFEATITWLNDHPEMKARLIADDLDEETIATYQSQPGLLPLEEVRAMIRHDLERNAA